MMSLASEGAVKQRLLFPGDDARHAQHQANGMA